MPQSAPFRSGFRPAVVLLALAAVFAGGALACGRAPEEAPAPAADAAGAPRRGGTAVVAASVDIGGLNELISSHTATTQGILDQLFLRLLEEQPDYQEHPATFRPRLADSYEFSADRKVLTFRLRRDVVWSDGAPVTAADVRWTWEAQRHPAVGYAYAEDKEAITDVEVVDPHTVRFHFSRPSYTQLMEANEGYILPRHAWSALPFAEWRTRPEWFQEHLVTDGPFLLEAWRPQQEIVLTANPRYYEPGLPRLDRVVFRMIPDQSQQLESLLGGSVDFMEFVPYQEVERVEAAPDTRLDRFWHRQFDFICWNTARPLFADPEVRRALTMAIDRQALIEAIWQGNARIAVSPILSSIWAHNTALEPWAYDPRQARRILEAKGWRDGDGDGILERSGRPFSFELTTNTGNAARADIVVILQEHLKRVGVDARPRLLELNALVEKNNAHDFDATVSAFAIDTSLDVGYAYHSDAIAGGYNWGSYANPEVDRLIEEVRRQVRPEDAEPLLHRLQAILHQDQPHTFLVEPERLNGLRERLQDVRSNPLSSFLYLREWWLQPAP